MPAQAARPGGWAKETLQTGFCKGQELGIVSVILAEQTG